jgi:hypothetical protein
MSIKFPTIVCTDAQSLMWVFPRFPPDFEIFGLPSELPQLSLNQSDQLARQHQVTRFFRPNLMSFFTCATQKNPRSMWHARYPQLGGCPTLIQVWSPWAF